MDKFQNRFRIPSARANWHDYNGGIYFVTICTKNREHYFGEITHCCRDVARNVCNENIARDACGNGVHAQCGDVARRCGDVARNVSTGVNTQMANISPRKNSLAVVIRGVKSSITHYANENNIPFAWQTRFHDRIIRNQAELDRISIYIEKNVVNWRCRDGVHTVSTGESK